MSSAVKKVAQVAVGAAIGFVQGGPWGALAGAALAFYVSSQQDKLDTGSLRTSEPSSQTLRSSKAAARYVLGRVSTGGVLAWGQEQVGDQTDGEWLHMVYVLSEGEIDGLEDIFLGEEVVQAYGEHASYELITNPTQVNAFLKANSPDWRDTQIGRGLSFVRLSFKYSAEKYPSGIPDVRFVLRGRRDIYDPRTGTAGYSENTALHILWFLRNRCGVPDDEIVFASFANSASVCDEMLANADGSTSARYRSGCVIGADESRTQVMQKLEAACGGKLIRVGGRWMLQVGAYYGPYDFEITEDMVIGTVTGSTEPTNDSAINTVRGTFVDPTQAWAETDYPEVSVSEWVVADGGEAAETLSFSYVSNPYQAQRLANIELRRRRAGGTLSIPMNFMGYNCRPGRSVKVNLPSLNIVGEFIVTDWSMSADSGCNVSVAQNEPAIFDDAVGQPYNPIGFIKLPAGGLGSPTGLAWSTEDIAESVQGTLSWAAPYGVVTGYAITIRQGATAVQAQQVPATALKLPLSGLPSGSYTMSVAALGPLTRSGEASITVSIDGPPIPESCVVQATIDTITLIPGNTLHGLNGGTYEYFFSTNPQAAEGEYLGQGLSLTHTGLAFATNYAYFVRSKNAYGASAFLKVVASTSTDVENMLDALKDKIEGGQLAPALRQEIELISGPPSTPGSVNARIQDLGEQVAEAQQDLQQQIDVIADLADSMPYDGTKTYTAGQAVLGADGVLYQALKVVPVNTAPPNASYWADIGQAVRTADGIAARVTTVETKVTEQDGKLAAESTRIDGVQSSLDTTNQNVNAAQQAAQDAATLAGGKGKVIVQSAAPAAADRLAQNLWIDTTGNANTPKRWNGSAWSAVTDKVATDAAAAAANALSVAQTKADATVVDSLSSKVNQQGDTLTSQGQALTGVQNSLTTTNQNVTAAQQAAQAASDAAGAKGKVLYQSTAPAVADRLAQNLWIDTTSNANTPKRWNGTAWVAVTDKVATDAAAAAQLALAQVATKAEASALQTLDTEVKSHGTTLTSQGAALTQISNQIGNVGGDNLLANSSFEELATASRAKYWNVGATATGTVTSMVDSPLAQSTKAQRVEHPALPAGGYVDLTYGGDNVSRPKARPGAQYALSVFARGTPGVAFRQYLQFRDAAGAVLSAPVAMHTLTADYGRFVLLATAPADTVSVTVWAGRMLNGGSTTISAWSEMDNVQFQEGAVATAYGPSTEQSAAVQAAATQALQSRVEQNEAGLSSQGASIVTLNNGLVATNQNVTTAQQAAQAAATAAGAKGEVIYGATAPAADKRLAQNLWIDTTGNANTPKRWNGSAWVAVTDKVATDAAAAAASALTQVATKAEAAALQAVTTRVEQNEAGLSSQGSSIINLENSLTTTNQNVTAAQQAAQAAATAAGAKGEVIYGTTAPTADKRLAQNLWIDTTGNANTPKRWNGSAWVAVTDKVATDAAAAAASALTQVATKAEASVVQALSTTVGQQGTTLTSQGQSITELRNTIGGIGAGGLDAAPGATWQFDTSVEGWSATNATLTAGTGSMTITATANDPNLVSPIVSINGALYSRIKVKITRRAGAATDWDSSLFYQTAGHGFSGSYIARAANPNIAIGESAIVEWDMANLFAGGNDWITSTITRLRIDIGALSGGAFEIDWIAVGRLGPGASAAALQQVSTNVTQQGEQLTAQASRLDGLYVQVNPEMEGDSSGLAGATGGLVGVWTEQSARVEDGIAMGRQVETVQAQMGQTNASVQQVSEVVAGVDGKVSAISSWKTETNASGKKVATGIIQGSDGTVGEILLSADRVAIINGLNGPEASLFVFQDGQLFLNSALINQAFIQSLVVGMTLRSQAVNAQGLPLIEINLASGSFTVRGQDANGSTLLNNGGLYVYDANGIERTAVGRLT
ncbi:phage tail tip fiber protein [Pseudomonas asiatica]